MSDWKRMQSGKPDDGSTIKGRVSSSGVSMIVDKSNAETVLPNGCLAPSDYYSKKTHIAPLRKVEGSLGRKATQIEVTLVRKAKDAIRKTVTATIRKK